MTLDGPLIAPAGSRPTSLPALLRAQDLAAALGLKVHTVREWIRRGVIPAAKVGRYYVIRREALLAHLESCERRLERRRTRSRDQLGLVTSLAGRRRRHAMEAASLAVRDAR